MNFQPLSIKPNNLRLQQPHFGHLSTAATVRILVILMNLRVFLVSLLPALRSSQSVNSHTNKQAERLALKKESNPKVAFNTIAAAHPEGEDLVPNVLLEDDEVPDRV